MANDAIKGIILNESNWSNMVSDFGSMPFRISEIKKINKELPLHTISFKYNFQGKEIYKCGNKSIVLAQSEYLISANNNLCEVSINEKDMVDKGLCVDIDINSFSQGLSTLLFANSMDESMNASNYFLSDVFFNKFKSNDSFDNYLQGLFINLKQKKITINQELNFDFILHFLTNQLPYIKYFHNIPVLKASTKRHLYDKMLTAKNLINDSIYSSNVNIAQQIHLSPFRYYHLFKKTFGISPHQYLLKLRMNEAIALYKTGNYTWTEIAHLLQFADLSSFSKFYKKSNGVSPNKFHLQ